MPDQGPSESASSKSLLLLLSGVTALLVKCLSGYASQEGKSCKLSRVKNEPALWLCLTSAEQLEFVAILVAKGLFQCELRAVALPEPSPSGNSQVFPDRK